MPTSRGLYHEYETVTTHRPPLARDDIWMFIVLSSRLLGNFPVKGTSSRPYAPPYAKSCVKSHPSLSIQSLESIDSKESLTSVSSIEAQDRHISMVTVSPGAELLMIRPTLIYYYGVWVRRHTALSLVLFKSFYCFPKQ